MAGLHAQRCPPSGARQPSASQQESCRSPGQAWAGSAKGLCGLRANGHEPGSLGPAGLGPEGVLGQGLPSPHTCTLRSHLEGNPQTLSPSRAQPATLRPWTAPALCAGAGLRPGSSLTPSTLRRPPSCTGGAAGAQLPAHQPSPLLPASGLAGPAAWGASPSPALASVKQQLTHLTWYTLTPRLSYVTRLGPVSLLTHWTLHGLCCSLHF